MRQPPRWCRMQRTDDTYQGNNQTGADIAEMVRAIALQLAIPFLEVLHLQEAGNLTRIVTKNDTTDGHKGTHEQ